MSFSILRVPASSANLGPGFDSLGLALDVYLECRFQPAAKLAITVEGRDSAVIPAGPDNLIWQTAHKVAADRGCILPPVELQIHNGIPLGKGLGSSAAALVAGVVVADGLLGLKLGCERIIDIAARMEGHPDNVAACVLGSVVASATDADGVARAVRLEVSERFGVGVVVPDFPLPTVEARRVLPTSYSREDTILNVQRSTLLIAALTSGTTSAFPCALEDRIHQPYRQKLVPGLAEMTQLRAPGLLGCALSGAGPSILVFYERGASSVCELVRQIFASHGKQSELITTEIARNGYSLA